MIGTNLKRIRETKNISIETIARELRRKESVIHSWEMGISIPDEETIIKLARFFNISIDDLLLPSDITIIYIDELKKDYKKIVRDLLIAYTEQSIGEGTVSCEIEDNKIKYLRKVYRNTQSQLGAYLDVSRALINAWEMNLSRPSVSNIISMSLKYKIAPSFFLQNNAKESVLLSGLTEEQIEVVNLLVDSLLKLSRE